MKNLSTDVHGHDHEADRKLYELLTKEGSDSPGDDEEGTVGTNPDLYPDPEDYPSGPDPDASRGEQDTKRTVYVSDSFLTEFKKSREEMLSRLFDSKSSSDAAEQKTISQRFAHGSSGEYQTSSPQLSEKALPPASTPKTASATETLVDRVRRAVGRS